LDLAGPWLASISGLCLSRDIAHDSAHRQQFEVEAADIDDAGRLSIPALFNRLVASAAANAGEMGISVESLARENLGWMLRAARIELFSDLPPAGATVAIENWPSAMEKLYAHHDFLLSAQGGPQGAATSTWLVVDLMQRKPVLLPERIRAMGVSNRARALEDRPAHTDPRRFIEPERDSSRASFRVTIDDLDDNFHLSHRRYLEWALAAVPKEQRAIGRIRSLEILFRNEAFFGDLVLASAEATGDLVRHRLVREEDLRELMRMVTEWTSRP
jgi:acyl-ACP thioesterase